MSLALAGGLGLGAGCSVDVAPDLELKRLARPLVRGQVSDGESSTVAALLVEQAEANDRLGVLCTATLIAPTVLITAAHCLEQESVELANGPNLWVSFSTDLTWLARADATLPEDAVWVTQRVSHPGFSVAENFRIGLGPSHDVGLILLERPVLDRYPSVLGDEAVAEALQVGAELRLAGYGLRDAGGPEGSAPDDVTGLKTAGAARVLALCASEMQVGRPEGPYSASEALLVDRCGGDSGGPAFLEHAGIEFLAAAAPTIKKARARELE